VWCVVVLFTAFYWLVINLCVLAINTEIARNAIRECGPNAVSCWHLRPGQKGAGFVGFGQNNPSDTWLTIRFRLSYMSVCCPCLLLLAWVLEQVLYTLRIPLATFYIPLYHFTLFILLMWFCTQLKTTWLNFHVKLQWVMCNMNLYSPI